MKCRRSIAVAALIAAVATLAHVDAQEETPTPTPTLGPAPGTLGASSVAGIPIPGTPAASSASSSSGQKPGSNGSAAATGSFDQDELINGSSSSLPGLDDPSRGDEDGSNATAPKLTGSTDGVKTTAPTPTPSPTSAANHAKLAFGAITTAAVVVVTTLFV
uniref:RxLR effector protein n=1 Tax=Globisporangium ultimum (strain ATCC 200006 / CBS 805.95 / DAOM BR144) TaxID=431595 RepID=K3X5D3_GLOUD